MGVGVYKALRDVSRAANVLIPVWLVLLGVAYRQKSILPPPSEMLPALNTPPEQREIKARVYEFDYGGAEYMIQPRAEYSIRGLVVTHNDISAFDDIYHTSNSVDLKDLCVIWGNNASSGIYKKMEFWSEPWTCFMRTNDSDAMRAFSGEELSNTHMLSQSDFVREKIRSVHIGDQVEFTGQLIDYHPAGASEQLRKSSLVRTDTGNGACEVMMVDSMEVLKPGNPKWYQLFSISKKICLALIACKVLCFLVVPFLEMKYGRAARAAAGS